MKIMIWPCKDQLYIQMVLWRALVQTEDHFFTSEGSGIKSTLIKIPLDQSRFSFWHPDIPRNAAELVQVWRCSGTHLINFTKRSISKLSNYLPLLAGVHIPVDVLVLLHFLLVEGWETENFAKNRSHSSAVLKKKAKHYEESLKALRALGEKKALMWVRYKGTNNLLVHNGRFKNRQTIKIKPRKLQNPEKRWWTTASLSTRGAHGTPPEALDKLKCSKCTDDPNREGFGSFEPAILTHRFIHCLVWGIFIT